KTAEGEEAGGEESAERRKATPGAKPGGPRTNSGRRRGNVDGRRGEAMEKLKEFSEQDLEERRRRIAESSKHRLEFDRHIVKVGQRGHHALAQTTVQKGEPVVMEE